MRYINVAPVLNIWYVRNMVNSITIYGEAYFQYFKFIVPLLYYALFFKCLWWYFEYVGCYLISHALIF